MAPYELPPVQILHPLDTSGQKFVAVEIKQGGEVSEPEEGKIPVDLFFYNRKTDTRGDVSSSHWNPNSCWSKTRQQVDADFLLSGGDTEKEFWWWWVMYFPIGCRAQVMQNISLTAMSVVGKGDGVPKRSVEVHIERYEQEGGGMALGKIQRRMSLS